jgi:Tubulin-tyrosine ligase family
MTLYSMQDVIGSAQTSSLITQMAAAAASVVHACSDTTAAAATQLKIPRGSCFQMLGLDFVLEAGGKAWLLEVNATPSMAVKHIDPATHDMIWRLKHGFLSDMVRNWHGDAVQAASAVQGAQAALECSS